jgi:hypothetical protein
MIENASESSPIDLYFSTVWGILGIIKANEPKKKSRLIVTFKSFSSIMYRYSNVFTGLVQIVKIVLIGFF